MSSWRNMLLRIGDKCPEYGTVVDYKEHIETCFSVVRRELELSGSDILHYMLQCAEQLPHKIPLYGALVGLINLEDEDFVEKILENAHTSLQEALNLEQCDRIRILLRLLTVLMCSKVLQPTSLVVVFETLLSSAATTVDEEKGNPSWQARGDFYVTCILSCLPWGGAELIEQAPEEIERVMVGVEAYLSIRRRNIDGALSYFSCDDTWNSVAEKDFLEDLWGRVQDLSSNGWKVDSVPRPHLSFEAQLVSGKAHEFGSISCPEEPATSSLHDGPTYGMDKHIAELKYPQRIRRLNIFPTSKFEDMQPIDRFVAEEYLLDVLLFLNGCRKECASSLATLPVPFRYEYLMAETLFSQLLHLPRPPFKPMYYTLVIMDLCKALPGAFPAVVAGAVRALFERIADLDMECRTRLILWFSHHLSNFQFIWPWEEWAHVLDLPTWSPQRVFVQEVLEREVRLSYWDKVKQSIESSPGLEELLPPRASPNFKYSVGDDQETNEQHGISVELRKRVKGKQTARDIISWIDENVLPNHDWEFTHEVVVQTLLDIGSKSFTHLITVLERYGQVLSRLCPDQDKQVILIDEISSYWKSNSQMAAITIDRMMGYRLISSLAIVKWVFSPENIEQFHVTDRPWEVLRNTISKTYNRIYDLRNEVLSLKSSLASVEETAAKAKAELDDAESKLSLVDGEPVLGENPAKMKRLRSRADQSKEEVVSLYDSLEAKEALLVRAIEENEALFINLYQNFSKVLVERLPDSSTAKTLRDLKSTRYEEMSVDVDASSTMDVDNENGDSLRSNSNGGIVGEKEHWCLTTLGYVKSISRQYASEIWPFIERLEAEVFSQNAHPLFRQSAYLGLGRLTTD